MLADPTAVIAALADDHRRRAFAAVVLGATTTQAVIEHSGLSASEVAKSLGKLVDLGVVIEGESGLAIDGQALQAAARDARARPPSTEHDDQPDDVRKVLRACVQDGRIVKVPPLLSQRLQILLDWLAQDFEPGRHYTEKMVNLIIGRRHHDTAMLRRYLVDHGFLDRESSVYWRSGGRVE